MSEDMDITPEIKVKVITDCRISINTFHLVSGHDRIDPSEGTRTCTEEKPCDAHKKPVIRDCPPCEEGKHRICLIEVLGPDDPPGYLNWVVCPCAEREHTTLVHFVPVDEKDDEW